MSHVFVVDTNKQALDPVHPAKARLLLDKGQAAVFKRYPFTIILKTDTGTHRGRVAVRASGSFDITTNHGKVAGIGYRFCRVLHKRDGYSYRQGDPLPLVPQLGTPTSSPCLKGQRYP